MDARTIPYYPAGWTPDFENLVIIDREKQSIKAAAVICPGCRGRGQVVNPSVDGHGLSAEDFAEDPDFASNYMAGLYDVACFVCHGAGRVLRPTDANERDRLSEDAVAEQTAIMEMEEERRMGA